jgi:acyl carrier protein
MNVYDQIVLPAAEEYNKVFYQGGQVQLSTDAFLSGNSGSLDSLELVNFIVIVEKKIKEVSGRELRLVTEDTLRSTASPFLTLGSLATFIQERLGNAA